MTKLYHHFFTCCLGSLLFLSHTRFLKNRRKPNCNRHDILFWNWKPHWYGDQNLHPNLIILTHFSWQKSIGWMRIIFSHLPDWYYESRHWFILQLFETFWNWTYLTHVFKTMSADDVSRLLRLLIVFHNFSLHDIDMFKNRLNLVETRHDHIASASVLHESRCFLKACAQLKSSQNVECLANKLFTAIILECISTQYVIRHHWKYQQTGYQSFPLPN